MKKFLALLLALCVVLGLAACTKDPVDNTGSENTEGSSNVNPDKPYAGTTMQIWGLVGDTYQNIEKINAKSWLWMVCAAIEEWAALNEVTLEYVSGYNQDALTSSMNSGAKPDFCYANNKFPAIANLGLVKPFTEEQKAKLSEVIGDSWFAMYRGEACGITTPWTAVYSVYYNKSLMERYGVKTPSEYIKEGNWTWDTFMEVARACTKDVDGDGKLDSVGTNTHSIQNFVDVVNEDPATGKLSSNMASDANKAYAEMLYKGAVEEKYITVDYRTSLDMMLPTVAMAVLDCEAYNFMHHYRTLENGDVIETVLPPAQTADGNPRMVVQNYGLFIPATSDASDAATDMLAYICKAGLKWMEDHSKGLYQTEYEGITGACAYSKAWKEQYDDYMWERDDEFAKIKDVYNQEYYTNMLDIYLNKPKAPTKTYTNVEQSMYTQKENFENPPATALAILNPLLEAQIEKYNKLFLAQ